MAELAFHIYTVEKPAPRRFLSVLPPALLAERSLPPEAIVGEIHGDPERITPESFTANNVFMAVLHFVIAAHGPSHPQLMEAAAAQQTGEILLVDQRTSAVGGATPPSIDVLGTFEVQGGQVQRYRVNPDHALLTADGLFEVDDYFFDRLLLELTAILTRAPG